MTAAALFTIHVEVTTQDGNTLRVSIGNVTKTEGPKVNRGGAMALLPAYSMQQVLFNPWKRMPTGLILSPLL